MSANEAPISREEAALVLQTSERNVRRYVESGLLELVDDGAGNKVLLRDAVLQLAADTSDSMTQTAAAEQLGVDRRTVRRMLDAGRLRPIVTVGGRSHVSRASVAALLVDKMGHPDGMGHPLDMMGHHLIGLDTMGHHVIGLDTMGHQSPDVRCSPPGDEELIPLFDEVLPPAGGTAPSRARGRRRASLALAGAAVVVAGVLVARTISGSEQAPARLSEAPATSPSHIVLPTVAPDRTGMSHPVRTNPAPPVKSKPVSHPVQHVKKHRPVVSPSGGSGRTPSAVKVDPICLDVYGPEGLC